ncbi:hypothetical protein K474DRAFT_1770520 [Panus rudis PR-1116 ss-1]|nr:hypothetical protein K474DRAFT_1770520 [Panus rudis PR-1116 ss-1]
MPTPQCKTTQVNQAPETFRSSVRATKSAANDATVIDDCIERVDSYVLWTGGLSLYVAFFYAMSHRIIIELPVRAYSKPSHHRDFRFEQGPTSYYPPPKFATALVSNTTRVKFFWLASLLCCIFTVLAGHGMKRRLRRYRESAGQSLGTTRQENLQHLRKMRWRILETAALLPLLFLSSMFLFLMGIAEYLNTLHVLAGWFVVIFITTAMIGSSWLILSLAHRVQFLFSRDLDLPADIAFNGDEKSRADAMLAYQELETMRTQLSTVDGPQVVQRIRETMTRLLARPVPTLNENFDDLWRMPLRGRGKIVTILTDAIDRKLFQWKQNRSDVVWEDWMTEAFTAIDCILASAPETDSLGSEAMSAGQLTIALLAQNEVVAQRVLMCLAARDSGLEGQEPPPISDPQVLRNLVAAAKLLSCTGRVDPLALRKVVLAISKNVGTDARKIQDDGYNDLLSQFNCR